jgi:hypothetical protein
VFTNPVFDKQIVWGVAFKILNFLYVSFMESVFNIANLNHYYQFLTACRAKPFQAFEYCKLLAQVIGVPELLFFLSCDKIFL